MYRLIDDLDFESEFHPLLDESGAWRQLWWGDRTDEPVLLAAAAQDRIWTCVDAGERVMLINGNHLVNRLHYVVTKVPFSENGQIEVGDLEEFSNEELRYLGVVH